MFLKTNLGYLSQIAQKNMQLLIHITIMPSLVVIGQQIKEKRRGGGDVVPPQPIWFQKTRTWIGLNKPYIHPANVFVKA